jgi:bacterioferritin (cytochrome b1)
VTLQWTPGSLNALVTRKSRTHFKGTATVEIKQAGQMKRRILFVEGKPIASDSSESMTVTRQGDVTTVKFDSGESYEIFDSIIFGG